MNDKSCNDCAKCKSKKIIAVCEHKGITAGDVPACSNFESATVTNGDVIKQMSNEELAEFLDYCPYGDCIHRHDEYPCKSCKRDWLNAPAESEER